MSTDLRGGDTPDRFLQQSPAEPEPEPADTEQDEPTAAPAAQPAPAVEKPAYWRIVHGRITYIVL